MKNTEKIAKKLNELLQKNLDAEKGYKEASENTENEALKNFFKEKSQERHHFGNALKNDIRSYGEVPEKETSVKGDIHREWMNFKTFFTDKNEEALLEEVERGEQAALEEYTSILSNNEMANSTKEIVATQHAKIKETLHTVKEFNSVVF